MNNVTCCHQGKFSVMFASTVLFLMILWDTSTSIVVASQHAESVCGDISNQRWVTTTKNGITNLYCSIGISTNYHNHSFVGMVSQCYKSMKNIANEWQPIDYYHDHDTHNRNSSIDRNILWYTDESFGNHNSINSINGFIDSSFFTTHVDVPHWLPMILSLNIEHESRMCRWMTLDFEYSYNYNNNNYNCNTSNSNNYNYNYNYNVTNNVNVNPSDSIDINSNCNINLRLNRNSVIRYRLQWQPRKNTYIIKGRLIFKRLMTPCPLKYSDSLIETKNEMYSSYSYSYNYNITNQNQDTSIEYNYKHKYKWFVYPGKKNTSWFHCGFTTIMESTFFRGYTIDNLYNFKQNGLINECVYDDFNCLIDDIKHPFYDCRGTPDEYRSDGTISDAMNHVWFDYGGIVMQGQAAFKESRIYDCIKHKNMHLKIQSQNCNLKFDKNFDNNYNVPIMILKQCQIWANGAYSIDNFMKKCKSTNHNVDCTIDDFAIDRWYTYTYKQSVYR